MDCPHCGKYFSASKTLHPKQQEVLNYLKDNGASALPEAGLNYHLSSCKALEKKGLIRRAGKRVCQGPKQTIWEAI